MHRDIVVIGASAGGVEALRTLAAGLPADLPASVFVVLHLAPHTPSSLHQILGRVSPLPAEPAEDGAPILPGRIRVGVADHHLLVEPDRVRVTRGPRENHARPAVDVLFRSAAYAFGPRVVGAVLTGNLDDGTAGLWAVKDRGGIALAQSPDEAQAPSMPVSAIRNVAVDRVVPVAEMARTIAALVRETVAPAPARAPAPAMEAEVGIARGEEPLRDGSMALGELVPNTCPECHGALFEIREGPIVRYRCHTGHAFSLETLFAEADEELDKRLWSTLRALNERILLLQHLERRARELGDAGAARHFAHEQRISHEWVRRVRDVVLEVGMNGGGDAIASAAAGRADPGD